jgi:hypothetical protein
MYVLNAGKVALAPSNCPCALGFAGASFRFWNNRSWKPAADRRSSIDSCRSVEQRI